MPLERIAADSGPLIVFSRSNLINIVRQVTGEILVPSTVFTECTRDAAKPGARALIEAQKERRITVTPDPEVPGLGAAANLDAGEMAAIALAIFNGCPVLMDERSGRTIANLHDVSVIGSAGILLTAKKRGLIDQIGPILATWKGWGYFLSRQLLAAVLRHAGE